MNRADIVEEMRAKGLLRLSIFALVVANLVPVFGVLALGWQVFPILMLYCMENVVIGFYNVLRMVWCTGEGNVQPASAKWYLIPFFCAHYGLFSVGHACLVFFVFGSKAVGWGDSYAPSDLFWQLLTRYQLGWSLLGLVISHGVSFVSNYLIGGERHRAYFGVLLFQPYVRVIGMHLVVLFGAVALVFFNAPSFALVLLVLLKIGIDLRAHLAERAKFAVGGDWRDRKREQRDGLRTITTYR